jgi:hypothetical protein
MLVWYGWMSVVWFAATANVIEGLGYGDDTNWFSWFATSSLTWEWSPRDGPS